MFLMFSNDTLLYLERMSAAQIIAILCPRGPFRIKQPVQIGDRCSARVNTSQKCLTGGLMSTGPKCLSNLWGWTGPVTAAAPQQDCFCFGCFLTFFSHALILEVEF